MANTMHSNPSAFTLVTRFRNLCLGRGGELEQIQFLLGHVSVQTDGTIWDASSGCAMPVKRFNRN
jgi:hypothetical protein